MMEREYKKAKEAFETYNLNSEYEIAQNVLKYIYERIIKNKSEIEKILDLCKSKYT